MIGRACTPNELSEAIGITSATIREWCKNYQQGREGCYQIESVKIGRDHAITAPWALAEVQAMQISKERAKQLSSDHQAFDCSDHHQS